MANKKNTYPRAILIVALVIALAWIVRSHMKRREKYQAEASELKKHIASGKKIDIAKVAVGVAKLKPKDRSEVTRASRLAIKNDRKGLLELIDKNVR